MCPCPLLQTGRTVGRAGRRKDTRRVIDKALLDILVCPENHQRLELADEALLARVNQSVRAGTLTNRGGQCIELPLTAGLVREDRRWLYPIIDDIPVMLVDEAIPLT